MTKWIIPLIVLAGIFIAVYFWTVPRQPPEPQQKPVSRSDPETIEQEIGQAVRRYSWKEFARIDNLSISIEPVLKRLPGVENVVVAGPEKPAKRLIHILDWRLVDKDLYRVAMEHAHGNKLTDAEYDALYRNHLLDVEC